MKTTCTATRTDGKPCRATSLDGGEFCFFHSENPEHRRQRKHGRRAGGVNAHRRNVLPGDVPDVVLQNPSHVTELVAVTISRLQRGEIETKIASGIAYLCQVALNSMELVGGAPTTEVQFIVHAPTEPIPEDPQSAKVPALTQ